MRVTLAGTSLSADEKETLANRLIEAFAEVEVGRDSPEIRNGFGVHLDEVGTQDLWMGQRPMVEGGNSGKAALVNAQVMAGPWNPEMKQELMERLDEIVRDVAGIPRSGAGADVWITFVEVPEGAWGLGGRPVSIARIAPVFLEDRQQRIRAYLSERAAKAEE